MFKVDKKAYFRVMIEPSQAYLFPNIVMPTRIGLEFSEYSKRTYYCQKLQRAVGHLFQIKT